MLFSPFRLSPASLQVEEEVHICLQSLLALRSSCWNLDSVRHSLLASAGLQAGAQVKGRAKALLDKHPLSKCSAEVQAAADKLPSAPGARRAAASALPAATGATGATPMAAPPAHTPRPSTMEVGDAAALSYKHRSATLGRPGKPAPVQAPEALHVGQRKSALCDASVQHVADAWQLPLS